MLGWFRRLRQRRRSSRVRQNYRRVEAAYDAAQTTAENRRHWAQADLLAPNASTNPVIRQVLRSRARYEFDTNTYAQGIVETWAHFVVGTGPRLQLLLDNPETNRAVEAKFAAWSDAVGLADKLTTMRIAQCVSGGGLGRFATNRQLDSPVKLDLRLLEVDQVANPGGAENTDRLVDGIRFDESGNPTDYYVLRRHPGATIAWVPAKQAGDWVPAEQMVHVFNATRPGQYWGVPEITSALPLFALLRRYTLAVVNAAEQAALPGGVIYTDAPADSEAAAIEPLDSVELDRNTWMTMPYGWKIGQVKAEQPTTVYGQFKREILNEIARGLHMPYNIAACNSAGYNYSSGRLDHQTFFKVVGIDQARFGRVVMDSILRAWLHEATRVAGYTPRFDLASGGVPHKWFWDGMGHIDPLKESSSQDKDLANLTTNLADIYAKRGLDWESKVTQALRERQFIADKIKELREETGDE